jgi:hypothetical protein
VLNLFRIDWVRPNNFFVQDQQWTRTPTLLLRFLLRKVHTMQVMQDAPMGDDTMPEEKKPEGTEGSDEAAA